MHLANNPRPKNLAEGKYAIQSSTLYGGEASRATDGNEANQWHGGSCTHTSHEDNPWLMIDLGGEAIVNHVSILFCFRTTVRRSFVIIANADQFNLNKSKLPGNVSIQ